MGLQKDLRVDPASFVYCFSRRVGVDNALLIFGGGHRSAMQAFRKQNPVFVDPCHLGRCHATGQVFLAASAARMHAAYSGSAAQTRAECNNMSDGLP